MRGLEKHSGTPNESTNQKHQHRLTKQINRVSKLVYIVLVGPSYDVSDVFYLLRMGRWAAVPVSVSRSVSQSDMVACWHRSRNAARTYLSGIHYSISW
jgi:hypothetical protein